MCSSVCVHRYASMLQQVYHTDGGRYRLCVHRYVFIGMHLCCSRSITLMEVDTGYVFIGMCSSVCSSSSITVSASLRTRISYMLN